MSDAPPTAPPSQRLAGLTASGRAPARFADAERHRVRVKRLKIALPLLAGACVAAIFVSLVVNRKEDTHVAGGASPAIEMSAPVLKGIGDNGKPYEVVATQAVQNREGLIEVTDVKGRIELEDGVLTLTAKTGSISQTTNIATLSGGVHIQLGDTYTFDTEAATADMKAGIVTGDKKVHAVGQQGTTEADGFKVEKAIKRVTFIGSVQTVMNPKDKGGGK